MLHISIILYMTGVVLRKLYFIFYLTNGWFLIGNILLKVNYCHLMKVFKLLCIKSQNTCCTFIIVMVNIITRTYKIYLKTTWNFTYQIWKNRLLNVCVSSLDKLILEIYHTLILGNKFLRLPRKGCISKAT